MSMAPMPSNKLPDYLKPAPAHISFIDMSYLFDTGALYIPTTPARNALLRAYLEFVHPCMPLIEAYEFLQIIEDGTGENGKLSLLLFQSVMFAGTAFVGMEVLRSMGYSNRMAARKAFFQKARVCLVLTFIECAKKHRFCMTLTTKSIALPLHNLYSS